MKRTKESDRCQRLAGAGQNKLTCIANSHQNSLNNNNNKVYPQTCFLFNEALCHTVNNDVVQTCRNDARFHDPTTWNIPTSWEFPESLESRPRRSSVHSKASRSSCEPRPAWTSIRTADRTATCNRGLLLLPKASCCSLLSMFSTSG